MAILDALLFFEKTVIGLQISDVHQRELLQHHSYISNVAYYTIVGFRMSGYEMVHEAIAQKLNNF